MIACSAAVVGACSDVRRIAGSIGIDKGLSSSRVVTPENGVDVRALGHVDRASLPISSLIFTPSIQ